MNKIVTITLLLFLFSLGIKAQDKGRIAGKITDEFEQPLSNITVKLNNTDTSFISDVHGEFLLENIPYGTHTLTFEHLNYDIVEKTVILNQQENLLSLTVLMYHKIEELQEVEITGRKSISYKNDNTFGATKTATKIIDIPQSVSVVTKEVIADQQAFRITEVAKNLSGVNNVSYYDAFTLRGFELSSETGSLINGLQTVGIFGPQPLLVNIERVEVIKGPASALYGNANPGGTMNSVTKKPLAEDRKSVSFTTGSYNTKRATLDFTGALNEQKTFLYRLNLGYENSDSFRTLQENNSYVIAPSFSFLPNKNTRVNVELVLTQQDGKLDRGQPIQGFDENGNPRLNSTPISFAIGKVNDFHTNRSDYLNISLSQKITEAISFNASYLHFDWTEDLQEHRTANGFALRADGTTDESLANLRVDARQRSQTSDNLTTYFVAKLKSGAVKQQIVLGYDYLLQKLEPGAAAQKRAQGYLKNDGSFSTNVSNGLDDFVVGADGFLVPNVPFFNLNDPSYEVADLSEYSFAPATFKNLQSRKLFTHGFYVQDQIDINKLKILLGLRYETYTDVDNYKKNDENEVEQNRWLPRLGAVYSVFDNINLYGTYAEGFRPQSVSDATNTTVGNIDPEDSNIIEFGAKGEFFNKKFLATTSVYRIARQNVVVDDFDTNGDAVINQAGEVVSKGFEVEVAGNPLPELSLTANYALNDIEITEGADGFRGGQTPFGSPKHLAGFWGRYTFNNRTAIPGLGIGLGANYASKQKSQFGTQFYIPEYTVFDGALYYNIHKFKINLTVNNLFDKTYWIGALTPQRLFPGAPRNFLLNVAYTF